MDDELQDLITRVRYALNNFDSRSRRDAVKEQLEIVYSRLRSLSETTNELTGVNK